MYKLFHASLVLAILIRFFTIFKKPQNVLLSKALLTHDTHGFLVTNRHMVNSPICDSGAWSVDSGRSDLTLDEYILYLKQSGSFASCESF